MIPLFRLSVYTALESRVYSMLLRAATSVLTDLEPSAQSYFLTQASCNHLDLLLQACLWYQFSVFIWPLPQTSHYCTLAVFVMPPFCLCL